MSTRFHFLRLALLSAATLFAGCSGRVDDGGAGALDDDSGEEVESISQALVLQSDPELAAFLLAVSQGELAQAELALERAADPTVIDFARTLIAVHGHARQQVEFVLSRLGVAPVDTPLSASVIALGARQIGALQGLAGPAFDRAYLDFQVGIHAQLLSQLQVQLINYPPGFEFSVNSLLPDFRAAVAKNFALARSIQGGVGGGGYRGRPGLRY